MTKRSVTLFSAGLLVLITLGCEDRSAQQKTAATPPPVPNVIPPRKVATPAVVVPDDQIQSKVIELVADQAGKRPTGVTPTTNLRKDLNLDDLDNVGLVMQLEDTFGFAIPDDDAKRLSTIASITEYVRFRRAAK